MIETTGSRNDPMAVAGRRFQVRLRTLMIVVTLVAVLCNYVAHEAKFVREREATLASIKKARGEYILADAPPVWGGSSLGERRQALASTDR